MGLGTAIGGKKIVKSVGMDMVKMEPYQKRVLCEHDIQLFGVGDLHRPALFQPHIPPLLPIMGGCFKAHSCRSVEHGGQYGPYVGAHVPGLRPYRFRAGEALLAL